MNFEYNKIEHFIQFYQKFKLIPIYVLVYSFKRSYKNFLMQI